MAVDPQWMDVAWCWAWRGDCRIDSNLLEALGTWGAAGMAALIAWAAWRLQKQQHSQANRLEAERRSGKRFYVACRISEEVKRLDRDLTALRKVIGGSESILVINAIVGNINATAIESVKDELVGIDNTLAGSFATLLASLDELKNGAKISLLPQGGIPAIEPRIASAKELRRLTDDCINRLALVRRALGQYWQSPEA